MTPFLHLNCSFTDDIGLSRGKSSSILYFASLNDPFYRETISVSLLDELFGQIGMDTSFDFGNGLSGIWMLLMYMEDNGLLEEPADELFAEVEPALINYFLKNNPREYNLDSGVAGFGLYFLSRMNCLHWTNLIVDTEIYRKCVLRSIEMLDLRVSSFDKVSSVSSTSYTLWEGLAGVYLYTKQVTKSNEVYPHVIALANKLEQILLDLLANSPVCWEMLETYFVLFQFDNFSSHLQGLLQKFLVPVSTVQVDFYKAAWYAMLLKILNGQRNSEEAVRLSTGLERLVRDSISERGIKNVFPFDERLGCIPMGLNRGLCGSLLPLFSIQTDDYNWLSLFGIRIQGNINAV